MGYPTPNNSEMALTPSFFAQEGIDQIADSHKPPSDCSAREEKPNKQDGPIQQMPFVLKGLHDHHRSRKGTEDGITHLFQSLLE